MENGRGEMLKRIIAFALCVFVFITYTPVTAYAFDEQVDSVPDAIAEATLETEGEGQVESEEISASADTELPDNNSTEEKGESWDMPSEREAQWLPHGNTLELYGYVNCYDDDINLEYRWLKGDEVLEGWTDLIQTDDEGKRYNEIMIDEAGEYSFFVREKDDPSTYNYTLFTVYPTLIQDGLEFDEYSKKEAIAWNLSEYDEESGKYVSLLTGDIVIPDTVTLADGRTRSVKIIEIEAPEATSITIPSTVTDIWGPLGMIDYRWDDEEEGYADYTLIPGFVIYGTKGSAAERYAKQYGITFIDVDGNASWRADDVASVQFIPTGSADRFTYYQYSVPFGHYPYDIFEDGDTIIANLADGSEKTLVYCCNEEEENSWLIKEDNKELEYGYEDEDGEFHSLWPQIVSESDEWNLGANRLRLKFGTHSVTDEWGNVSQEDTYSGWFAATLLKNPVTAISYRPVGTTSEINERFTFPEGLNHYYFPFEEGDKLTVTIEGQRKEYVYNEYEGDFYCENKVLPEEYGILYCDGIDPVSTSQWEAGNDYSVYLTYAGVRSVARKIHVIDNPIRRITFVPALASIPEAKMRLYEYEYGDGQYRYEKKFDQGDSLIITWTDGETSEYVYSEYTNEGENETWMDFIDEEGYSLPYPVYVPETVSSADVYEGHITEGLHSFCTTYLGKTVTYNLEVTKSEYEDFELVDYILDALNLLEKSDDEIRWQDYRDAQQTELEDAYYAAYDAIFNAESLDDVDAALDAYNIAVASVKTDAQLTEEEEEAARQAAEAARQAEIIAQQIAAANAARNGSYDAGLPAVKASKPKAAKKAFTAKWKKLKKKQLKSGVTNIEVWACADGAFANGSTIERVVGKKKASLKLKGMQKGVTYFVKVRAIKYVGGVKYVGPWSAVKKVKVKK